MSLKSLLPSIWTEDEKGEDLFTTLQKEIDRVFEAFREPAMMPALTREGTVGMRVDISETDQDIKITAELPGVKQDDLKVELVDDVLTISGEKKSEQTEEKEEQGRKFHRIERSYGSFRRSMTLPKGVDADAIEAGFRDGVLTVTVKKPVELQQAEAAKRIEVKAA
jgi:HSP20 family protein